MPPRLNIIEKMNKQELLNFLNGQGSSSEINIDTASKEDLLNYLNSGAAPPEPTETRQPPAPEATLGGVATGAKAFGETLIHTPENVVASAIQAFQGQTGASVTDPGYLSKFVRWVNQRNEELSKKYKGQGDVIPGVISSQDVAELGQNLAFSGVSLAGSIVGGIAGGLTPVPGGAIMGGMAGGGVMAYRMQGYSAMQNWLEKVNKESIQKTGKPISPEQEAEFKQKFETLASESGLWEAGPEAIGNVLDLALLMGKGTVPGRIASLLPKGVKGKIIKVVGRAAGVLGVEETTETITQHGQHNVEVEAGMTDQPRRSWTSGDDLLKSAGEVFPQVLLLTGVMSGAGAGYRRFKRPTDPIDLMKEAESQPEVVPEVNLGQAETAEPQPKPSTAREAAETFFGPEVVREEDARNTLRKMGLQVPEDIPVKSAQESAQTFIEEEGRENEAINKAVLGGPRLGVAQAEAAPAGEKSQIEVIDEKANEAATSPLNDLPQPTQGQKEAGNYKKGHVNVHGLDISIENPKGSERSGVGPDGKPWSVVMQNPYGYIKGTQGKDKDHIDVTIGPDPESNTAYVVDQVDPKTGKFDEHKTLIGFKSEAEARRGYLENYEEGWKGLGAITEMPMDLFKKWVKAGRKTKPLALKEVKENASAIRSYAGQVLLGKQGSVEGEKPRGVPLGVNQEGAVRQGAGEGGANIQQQKPEQSGGAGQGLNVFQRMPEAELQKQAKAGVQGAKAELAARKKKTAGETVATVQKGEIEAIKAGKVDLPKGWTAAIGKTRTKEGQTAEAEVDWRSKRLVFSEQKHMDNSEIWNHEVAHVVIEELPARDDLFKDYIEAKRGEWKEQGYDPDWIVKNQFHREEIAMEYGNYLNDPKSVKPELGKVFEKHLGKKETAQPAKPAPSEKGEQKRAARKAKAAEKEFVKGEKSDIKEPMTSKKGTGGITTTETPKPDGGEEWRNTSKWDLPEFKPTKYEENGFFKSEPPTEKSIKEDIEFQKWKYNKERLAGYEPPVKSKFLTKENVDEISTALLAAKEGKISINDVEEIVYKNLPLPSEEAQGSGMMGDVWGGTIKDNISYYLAEYLRGKEIPRYDISGKLEYWPKMTWEEFKSEGRKFASEKDERDFYNKYRTGKPFTIADNPPAPGSAYFKEHPYLWDEIIKEFRNKPTKIVRDILNDIKDRVAEDDASFRILKDNYGKLESVEDKYINKETWEIPLADYLEMKPITGVQNGKTIRSESAARILHKSKVVEAIKKGKPVPPEVLKDYPDLPNTSRPPESGGQAISASQKPLSEMSLSEIVDDAFDIINEHIKKSQGLGSLGGNILNDELFDKLRPHLAEIAKRARAKAVDIKGYIFGSVDSKPEGQAKKIWELAGEKYAKLWENPEKDIVNPINRELPQAEKVKELEKLSKENEPIVKGILAEIDEKLGLESKYSFKLPEKIQGKANRPEIKLNKPWFDVEHVRDGFRFKSKLNSFEDIPRIAQIFVDHGLEFVKIDTAKMMKPKEWGWRFIAFDLRMPNGQLVEFYAPLKELDAKGVKDLNHKLFEKWRDKTDAEKDANRQQYLKDIDESYQRYQSAWESSLKRLGLDEAAALASFQSAVASLESVTRSKLSLRSSAEGMARLQTPSPPRTTERSSSATQTLPESGSRETNALPSSNAISVPPSVGNIPQVEGKGKAKTKPGAAGSPLIGKYSAEGAKKNTHEQGFLITTEREFKKDLRRFAKNINEFLKWDPDIVKGKDKSVTTNIAPVGGDGIIILWKPGSEYGIYIQVPVDRDYKDESLKLRTKGYSPWGDILYRATTKKNKYTGCANQYAASNITPAEFAKIIENEVAFYDKTNAITIIQEARDEGYTDEEITNAFNEGERIGENEGATQEPDEIRAEIEQIADDLDISAPSEPLTTEGKEPIISSEVKENAETGERSTETAKTENDRNRAEGPGTEAVPATESAGEASGVSEGTGSASTRNLQRRRGKGTSEPSGDEGLPGTPAEPARSDQESVGGKPGHVPGIQRPARGTDHRIQPGDLTRSGSWRDQAKTNLDVIELVKKLEAEGRQATPEEQQLLARYTGWGASELANNMFPGYSESGKVDPNHWKAKAEWKPLVKRLVDLLTPEEIKTAARSTQYAHYTSESVIRSIYRAMERFGFPGGKILEPGMGIGHFFGLLPENMAKGSVYTGIEFDYLTAAIGKYLYPNQNVLHADYTKQKLPNNFFDLAIGNPPFSSTKILTDPDYKKFRFALHDYFFAKSMDKVRPGGLLVFITSRYSMDKQGDKARKYLSERADLLGAIRLPQTAFKQNAGTEVVTDVIFLRKKTPGEETVGMPWMELKEVETPEGKVQINEYFADHPEMVLGRNSLTGSMYGGNEYTVLPLEGNIEEHFAAAVEKLPDNVFSIVKATPAEQKQAAIERDFNPLNKKEGGLYVTDKGTVMITDMGAGKPVTTLAKLSDQDLAWLKDYIKLRDVVKQCQYDQLNDGPWEESLKTLTKEYRTFVKKNGRLNEYTVTERKSIDEDGHEQVIEYRRYKNERLFRLDVESALVTALEEIKSTGDIVDGPFLEGRTIKRPSVPVVTNAPDALAVSLDQIGKLDVNHIAEIIHKPVDEVVDQLGDLIFEEPGKEGYILADEYLSGNVVKKLEEAKAAAELDPKYMKNVEALIKAQPIPLAPKDITVQLGANWVPEYVYTDFAHEILGLPEDQEVTYTEADNSWSIGYPKPQQPPRYGHQFKRKVRTHGMRGSMSEWGTPERGANEILSSVMNNQTIKVTYTDSEKKTHVDVVATAAANGVAKKMRERFKSWVWQDAERTKELLAIWNGTMNNIAPRKFDGSHLTLPGVSLKINVFDHVKRAAWRIIQTGNTYLAHAVGAGKTYQMIIAGMEQRRLGLIKKPLYVVPNHMLQQFANEFQELYPMANIMVADEENFHTDNRRRFVARATLNNPDAIIMTHSSFGLIRAKPETIAPVRDAVLNELRDALNELEEDRQGNRIKIKKMEKRIEQAEQRFNSMIAEGDNVVTFEDMGVDFIFVDEAHLFRKLDFTTNRQGKGIDPNGSKRSMDLYIKIKWLDSMNPGRSHVFASGTPITNTLGELYTVMRYFMEDQMEREGMKYFDSWANMFGAMETLPEMNAAGRYELIERFTEFVNVNELMTRVRTFMDVVTMTQLGGLVNRPKIKGGQPAIIITPASAHLKQYQNEDLMPRLEASRKWKPSKGQPGNPDPVINIITDGRLASIDMRFVVPTAKNDPNSKLNKFIDGIIAAYKETKNNVYKDLETGEPSKVKGGTQIVFYNHGFGKMAIKNRGFDSRAWLMKRLKQAGIPAAHVAWIDDYNTAAKKEALFKEMRNGTKRILIGSAKKMGTGMNVQRRLTHLQYLDPPWYPADVEQPDGRILRTGNLNEEVTLNRYATKGSYDSTMWQMVMRKGKFIEDAFMGENIRKVGDISETSQYEMAAALTSGDERAIRLAGLNSDISNLRNLQMAHYDTQRRLRWEKDSKESDIKRLTERVKNLKEAEDKAPDYIGRGEIDGKIGKGSFKERRAFGEELIRTYNKSLMAEKGRKQIGSLYGIPLFIDAHQNQYGEKAVENELILAPTANVFYEIHKGEMDAGTDPVGLTTRIINKINGISSDVRQTEGWLAERKEELKIINSRLGVPFEFEQELIDKVAEQAQLEAELTAEGADKEIPDKFSELGQVPELKKLAETKYYEDYLDAGGKLEEYEWLLQKARAVAILARRGEIEGVVDQADLWLKDAKEQFAQDHEGEPLPEQFHNVEEIIKKIKGGQETLSPAFLYSGVDITQTLNVLRGLRDNIQDAMPHLEALGRYVYENGATKLRTWRNVMRQHLGDLWNSFKDVMARVWEAARKPLQSNRGAIGTGQARAAAEEPAPAQVAGRRQAATQESRDIPGMLKRAWDEFRFQAQDKFHYLNKAQIDAARRSRRELPEEQDAYLAETRYHGMAGAAIDDFEERMVDPLLELMSRNNITVEEADEYLHARHAREANEHLREINPDREDNEALSGMSNEEADLILNRIRQGSKANAFRTLGEMVDRITQERRALLVESGLELPKTIEAWEDTYRYYVPLMREGFGNAMPRRGKGFEVRGGQKVRGGSTREVVNILANVIAQHEATIVRAEKAKVSRAFLNFAKNNPGPWKIDKPEKVASYDSDGLIQYRANPIGFLLADNVLSVRVNGIDHHITFDRTNLEAMRICSAMKNLDAADMGSLVRVVSKISRWLAMVNTSLNPEFIISNFARDLQTAAYNMSDSEADAIRMKAIKQVGKSYNGIRNFQKGNRNNEWAVWFERFRNAGGQTGWLQAYDDIRDRENELVRKIEAMKPGKVRTIKRGLYAAFDYISNVNTAVENAIRLSVFKNLVEADVTEAKAAKIAKELTVNFNRRGNMGPVLNAFYLFYNASIQGSARLIMAAATNKKVRKLMVATAVFAAGLDIFNRMVGAGDDDDNQYDKIPPWVKERNLIIMLPGKNGYIQIPLPWGYNVFHVMGQAAGEVLTKKNNKITDSALRVLGATVSSFNPVGGESSLLQMISPTLIDPFVQWAENKDWSGKPLRPEANVFAKKPSSQTYWSSVREPSKWIAMQLNKLTGGDEIRPGKVDISPEAIDLAIDTFTGGAGKFVSNVISTPIKLAKGDDIETYEIPVLRKVYGKPGKQMLTQEYYEHMDAVRLVDRQIKHYENDPTKLKEIAKEHKTDIRMIGRMEATQSTMQDLREQMKAIEKIRDPEIRADRKKTVQEKMEKVMEGFNKNYNRMKGKEK